jgi:MtrB/PioB family decaheme-associated outer membrane protein
MDRITRPVPASSARAAFAFCASLACGAASANAINPEGVDPTLVQDERGMSPFSPTPSRNPRGFMYPSPYVPARWSAEFGVLGGSDAGPRIHNYGDYRDGFVLSHFGLSLQRSAYHFDFAAGAVGRRDQSYRASVGRYGVFRTSFFLDQTPTLFTDQARTVFQGTGSGNLTLVPGLAPGNNTPAQVAAALQSAPAFELGFKRTRAGIDLDITPRPEWRLFTAYNQDRKLGTRASGGASSYPPLPLTEPIEPIDYRTHNVTAGAQWSGETLQANLAYSGSFFRNAIDTLTWDNPLLVGDPAVTVRNRMDLYPDNDFHNVKLDLSAALPMRSRISGGVSVGRMMQDDKLPPPTANSGLAFGLYDLSQWNVPGALSQPTAGARIDTLLTHLSGGFSPLRDLSLRAKWRRYEEDNKTRYTAFNPLTGQQGYIGTDGGVPNVVPDNLYRAQIRAVAFACDKTSSGVEADYQVLRRTGVTLAYDNDSNECRNRERARTDEGRYRLALSNRDLAWATIRVSYEYAKRTGDEYNFNPNAAAYANSGFLNVPATLAQLRKYDLADRRQQVANARVNFALTADMDLALAAKYRSNDYGAAYGTLEERMQGFNVEWNWQPRPRASAYAYYGFERISNAMALINDDPAGYLSGDANAGGAVYPARNRWEEQSRDDAHLLGLGFSYGFGPATLDAGYSYMYSPYRTSYSFASPDAIVGGTLAAPGAGNSMPVINFRQQSLQSSLRYSVSRTVAVRLYYRYERVTFDDWHYDGLTPAFFDQAVFLGAGPRNYSVSLAGVLLQVSSK